MIPIPFRSAVWCLLALAVAACAGPDQDRDRRSVVKRLYASTVQVLVQQDDGVRRTGSGVVLNADRETGEIHIVTAGHVLTANENLKIHVVGKFRKKTYSAIVLAQDDKEDIALIRTRGLRAAAVSVGGDGELGQEIWVVSYPWGRRRTLVTGVVSQVQWPETVTSRDSVPLSGAVKLIDATVGYGTSGGGVFDAGTGRLLGIVQGYRTVKIPLSDEDGKVVKLPVGGETTVIPVERIRAFLTSRGLGHVLETAAREN